MSLTRTLSSSLPTSFADYAQARGEESYSQFDRLEVDDAAGWPSSPPPTAPSLSDAY